MKIVLFIAAIINFVLISADDVPTCPVFKCSSSIATKSPEVGRECAAVSDGSSYAFPQNKFLKKLRYLSADDENTTNVSLQPCGSTDLQCDFNYLDPKNSTCVNYENDNERAAGDVCKSDVD